MGIPDLIFGRNTPKPARSKRRVVQMDDNSNVVNEYKSASAAAKAVGIDPKCIRDAASGVQIHAAGFVWRYKETK